jgi:hypothetical protein
MSTAVCASLYAPVIISATPRFMEAWPASTSS